MNRMTQVVAVSLAVAGLAACTSMSGNVARAPEPTPGAVTSDQAYIAQVERMARQRGIEVQWVNVPTRRVAATLE